MSKVTALHYKVISAAGNQPESVRVRALSVAPGDLVKAEFRLIIKSSEVESFQKMWVSVVEVIDSVIIGALDNDPLGDTSLKAGDTVHLRRDDILEFYPETNTVSLT